MGMYIAQNSSADLSVITLADADDLAILVATDIPQNISFTAYTRGARASCQPITQSCSGLDSAPDESPTCIGFPGFPANSSAALLSKTSSILIQSSNCSTCDHVDARSYGEQTIVDEASGNERVSTPYSLWMQFIWFPTGATTPSSFSAPNSSVLTTTANGTALTMLVNCSLSFYQIYINTFSGRYVWEKEDLAGRSSADGFAIPSRLGMYTNYLLSDLQSAAFSNVEEGALMAFLNWDLARLALAFSTSLPTQMVAPYGQFTQNDRIIGVYPFWPVVLIVSFLFAYSGFALVICIATAWRSRDHTVSIPSTGVNESVLELVQLRLRDPSTLVAHAFGTHEGGARPDLTLKKSALDMFEERPGRLRRRLRVGLHQPEAFNGGRIFGVYDDSSLGGKS